MTTPTITVTPDGDRFRWSLRWEGPHRPIRMDGDWPYSTELAAQAAAARQIRAMNVNERATAHKTEEDLG